MEAHTKMHGNGSLKKTPSIEFVFSHPDCTVGSGISPDRPTLAHGFMDFTIGRESHPAPKTIHINFWAYYNRSPSVRQWKRN